MTKPLTERQINNRVAKTIGGLRKTLELPRPGNLRPEIQWGLYWKIEKADGKPSAVVLIASAVRPEWLVNPRATSLADRFNPFIPKVREMLDAFCELLSVEVGLAVRYTWTLGIWELSTGNLMGLTS
jgi:hypothetical protein